MINYILIIKIKTFLSYSFIIYSENQKQLNIVTSQCISIAITDESNAFKLEKAYPMSTSEGENLEPYEFSVTNTCNNVIEYNIALEVLKSANRLESKNVMIKLDEEES